LLGAHEPWWSLAFSGVLILAVSAILAFLSGMSILRRVLLNTGVLFAAVGISSVVGLAAHHVFGV
jgi:VIT1/CCC1 family predicted Fe2+/Mn2+ transporter